MLLTSRPALEKELGRELTRTEDEKLTKIYQKILQELFPAEEWIEPLSKLYTRIFTPEELKDILHFYRTDSGRRLLEKQPIIIDEVEKMATKIFEQKQEKFVERLEAEFASVFSSSSKSLDTTLKDSTQLNVSAIIQACKAIQESPDIPVGCAFDYFEGMPAIVVSFQEIKTAEQLWQVMSDKVAEPFCQATNNANRQGIVFISLIESKLARVYSCESEELSDWFSYQKGEL